MTNYRWFTIGMDNLREPKVLRERFWSAERRVIKEEKEEAFVRRILICYYGIGLRLGYKAELDLK